MTQIAYILLCHKDPEGIIAQALRLTATGDSIAIHFDARAKPADYARIRAALAGNPRVTFARRRVKCGWGEWSLVAATLEALRAAEAAFPAATHFYMISGDCMPIKTAEHAHRYLENDDADFVETFDFFASDWIKTGIKEERLFYRHWFNERQRKRLFYASLDWQKRLGLKRRVPEDLKIRIGSQWWCLRRRTVEAVLEFIDRRPDVMRFFRTTWIPDETFFQTIVAHLVPEREIRSRPLTFLMFTDYGMPVTFHDDHHDLLLSQDYLFARKISPEAKALKDSLGALYSETGRSFDTSGDGKRQFEFLTARGRVGRRFAPRFWETEASLGRSRTLMLVTCKKWHVAKRLVERVRQVTHTPAVDYLFNEEATPLPDLGGIQTRLEKRMRHRRALVRMLFDYWQTDRLILCLDPASTDLIQDFYDDRAQVRLLEIDCEFSDDYLIGHARRVGLASPHTSETAMARLLPTIRYDVRFESDRLRDMNLSGHHRVRQSASAEENALPLAAFLDIPVGTAREIAATDYLFVD
ncbi:MAG: beta-1,6-N-acetylglucosaminyltransferase [Rhodobacterales bacterium]|nr:beta-1,6-N-acetylglucosaminyltransferase [Paracoccaceae bacterium]MDX5403487.1 beta-1,6-N-acetylglucosaminyltransferase [Rhodobacterales bacterium]